MSVVSLAHARGSVSRTVDVERGVQDPAISPDGKTLAVAVLGKIWLVPMEGGDARQLSFGTEWQSHPAWSTDGRFLAYAEQHRTGSELIVHALADGTRRSIFRTEFQIGQIDYHPTRPQLFFIEDRNQFAAHLWSVPTGRAASTKQADGSTAAGEDGPRQWTFGQTEAVWSFALSPDGTQVALEHVGERFPSVRDLVVMNLDPISVERLTSSPQVDETSVRWSVDGASLIYIDREEGVEHLTIRSLRQGAARRVYSSPYDGKQLALHPDGKTAVLVAGRKVFRVDLESGKSSPIPFRASFVLPARLPVDLLITNARLFDGRSADVMEQANVEVKAGRILRVWQGAVPARSSKSSSAVRVIDAKGRFLMAGLVDSHYHYWRHFLYSGEDMLAKGITSIRDPGADLAESLNLRDAIEHGLLTGPRIYTLGPLLDSYSYKPMVDVLLSRPESASALVRSLHAQGVDGIKLYYFLAPEVSAAVITAAKAVGLPVTGDMARTGWPAAIAAGISGVNHANNYYYGFVPDTQNPQWEKEPIKVSMARLGLQQYQPRPDPKGPAVQQMLRDMAARGVMLDATLTAYFPTGMEQIRYGLDNWQTETQRAADLSTLTLEAHRNGVQLLAGSDNNSLLDELERYEQIGVPNAVILQAATVNGAKWLHKEREFGTATAGSRADLLLLDADPLQQMKNIRSVALVIKDGRVVSER
ncbi:amidohydrolase family protein [Steroidobacter sp.]|uniref:amidohydrolase family protein n=1 Tax=Steroidobacter sp. TaxID=1978227 RepID=UPI001A41D8C4|nr:amidohydrolase family protein [Steroidobacter sp.]MBL8268480.1 amidohydrolase family protein [Steroidobacter sp.]